MTEARVSFASRLRDLALALLNATLMLAVLLVFGAWLLLGRVQDFAAETVGAVAETVGGDLRTRLDTQTTRVSDALARVSTLEDRMGDATQRLTTAPAAADPATAQELAQLRDAVQALNGTLADRGREATAPELAETRARLSALEGQLTDQIEKSRDRAQSLDTQTAAEIKALRTEVQSLTATLQDIQTGLTTLRQDTSGSLRRALQQLFLDLAHRIAPPGASPPTTEG